MKKKKKGTFFIFILIGIVFAWAGRTVEAKAAEVLSVAYPEDSSFIVKNADGSYSGYGVEYLEEISRYTGWKYEFVTYNFSDACDALKDGTLDLICTMQKTEEREAVYGFSNYDIGWEYACLYVDENNTEIGYEEFAAFEGMRIGFVEAMGFNADFEEYAKENGFTYEACYYSSAQEMEEAFLAGEIDAVTKNNLRITDGKRIVARFTLNPFYIATGKEKTELLAELNAALYQIKLRNPYYEAQLQEKYYADAEVSGLFLTKEEKKFLEECGVLEVVYMDTLGPVCYEEDGELGGIAGEVYAKLGEMLGLKFHFTKVDTFAEVLEYAKTGKADLVVSAESRLEYDGIMNLTRSYFEVPVVMVIKDEDYLQKDTVRIALRGADKELYRYIDNAFPEAELLFYFTPEECLDAALSEDVDLTFENAYMTERYLEQNRYKSLSIGGYVNYSTDICIGVSARFEDSELLTNILSRALGTISVSEKTQLVAQALAAKRSEQSLFAYLKKYQYEIISLVLVVACLWLIWWRYKKYKLQLELERLAYYDELTGLRKREKFRIDLKSRLQEAKEEKLALVYFDISRFRYLNAVLGMRQSNQLLIRLSELIKEALQEDDLCGRFYADDFMALYQYEDTEKLVNKLKDINARFHEWVLEQRIFYRIELVEGIYLIQDKTESIDEMLYRALLAKQSTTANAPVAFFDAKLKDAVERELEIESCMEAALANGEFQVYYQPKYDIRGECFNGAEALVRWIKPEGGMVYPNEFIPLFEKNGFIVPLDYYVYEQVLKLQKQRKENGLPLVRISVNLSRLHSNDMMLCENLTALAQAYGIEPKYIEFELTESAFTEDAQVLLEQIKKLRENGFTISIDDFGAGYSSLNLLREVAADIIKIDKGFLDESGDSQRSKDIIKGIMEMAKDIRMEVLCEGVETQTQLDFLRAVRCDYVQGYYFAKPMKRAEFEELLLERKAG